MATECGFTVPNGVDRRIAIYALFPTLMLKQWLRDLENPVIPRRRYEEALAIAKRSENENKSHAMKLFLSQYF